jgi:hypothetical protein
MISMQKIEAVFSIDGSGIIKVREGRGERGEGRGEREEGRGERGEGRGVGERRGERGEGREDLTHPRLRSIDRRRPWRFCLRREVPQQSFLCGLPKYP